MRKKRLKLMCFRSFLHGRIGGTAGFSSAGRASFCYNGQGYAQRRTGKRDCMTASVFFQGKKITQAERALLAKAFGETIDDMHANVWPCCATPRI